MPWNEKIKIYIKETFKDYFISRIILAAISSIARTIFFIILGIPYGLLLAWSLGIASLIPFAGAVVSLPKSRRKAPVFRHGDISRATDPREEANQIFC